MNTPLLVLQLQRMGDIILSFPLLRYLQQRFPGHPLWVMAEPHFFKELIPLAPDVTFLPPQAVAQLQGINFHLIVNLSHRETAAVLGAKLQSDAYLGLRMHNGKRFIAGFWQLYQASLTQNNRYNHFHWADLPILDFTQDATLPLTDSSLPTAAHSGRVGLFVGASTAEKRPDAVFWAKIARRLLARGWRPLFLGGPGERELGATAARAANLPIANLCGRLSLQGLADVLRSLDLCITPDTGPMHLAVLLGVPTLNLSMGTVHAWETGPARPGHHIVSAALSCTGCWICPHATPLCKTRFRPLQVANLADTILRSVQINTISCHDMQTTSSTDNLFRVTETPNLQLPGMHLYRSSRDQGGLHTLVPLLHSEASVRNQIAAFWQAYFLHLFHAPRRPATLRAAQQLAHEFPQLSSAIRKALRQLELRMLRHHRRYRNLPLPEYFWREFSPMVRPLSGYLLMRLQNESFATSTWRTVAQILDDVNSLL